MYQGILNAGCPEARAGLMTSFGSVSYGIKLAFLVRLEPTLQKGHLTPSRVNEFSKAPWSVAARATSHPKAWL